MRRNFTTFIKLAGICVISALVVVVVLRLIASDPAEVPADDADYDSRHEDDEQKPQRVVNRKPGDFFNDEPRNVDKKLIDWHDYRQIVKDAKRVGVGEQGRAETLPPEVEEEKEKMSRKNGFNALLSDKISVNRSLPDRRHPKCRDKTYLSELPTVSVVVPVFNEHWSTLMRTVYSVLNRSPPELLTEIILVDDFSSRDFLKDQLDEYVAENLPKVIVIHLPERTGLIGARLAGAKRAIGDVLVFLDSHVEATTNWLPPLLDPIARNYKVCMCPFIDVIAHDTFEYRAQDEGARGAFDWKFLYKRLPITEKDKANMPEPFESPVMAGGLFAISTQFFWELGGYDEGLDIWGAEQYELSFKIWMCGGAMYDAPCSRVGHIYRGPMDSQGNPRKIDFVTRNHKRVAEVWMDEYKKYVYDRQPHYYSADAGDLTAQHAIRERLKCKSFKWFMEVVAFDLVAKYPPVEPPDYVHGAVQNVAHPHLCVDSMNGGVGDPIGLFSCAKDLSQPQTNQNWAITWRKDLRMRYTDKCWDVSQSIKNSPVLIWDCHSQGGNQYFRYIPDKKWLQQGVNNRCLDCDPLTKKVFINVCDEKNENMQWNWGFVNQTAIDSWHHDL